MLVHLHYSVPIVHFGRMSASFALPHLSLFVVWAQPKSKVYSETSSPECQSGCGHLRFTEVTNIPNITTSSSEVSLPVSFKKRKITNYSVFMAAWHLSAITLLTYFNGLYIVHTPNTQGAAYHQNKSRLAQLALQLRWNFFSGWKVISISDPFLFSQSPF